MYEISYNKYYDHNEEINRIDLHLYVKEPFIDSHWTAWTHLCDVLDVDPYNFIEHRYPYKDKWFISSSVNTFEVNDIVIKTHNFEKFTPNKIVIKTYEQNCIYDKLIDMNIDNFMRKLNCIDYDEFDASKLKTRVIWRTLIKTYDELQVNYFELTQHHGTKDEVIWINKTDTLPQNITQKYYYPINPLEWTDRLNDLHTYLIKDIAQKNSHYLKEDYI